MSRTSRWITATLTAVTAATAASAVVAAPASAAGYSAALRTAVTDLTVATEIRTGYNRDLFPHWIDADGDRCNTRYEVLIAEATTAPTVSSPCTLTGGRWYSWYDGVSWTDPADLDIDHFVPLAEAWDSGARTWTTSRRQLFANDLADTRSLAAVTDNVNQAKGDQDPATWMPSYTANRCRYINDWVAVKLRWRLRIDTAERNALTSWAGSCPNTTISVTYAY
jgi:hypothetical protein